MGLVEFLRQWQGSRLAGGIALSVALHLALVAAVLWGPPASPTFTVKRGEPLIVELPAAPESPPPGRPGSPPTPPPARRTPPPRKASPAPTAVAARPAPPRQEPRPAEPAREQRVARAEPPAARPPVPKAPDPEQAVPAPKAPEADTPAKVPEPPAEAAAPPEPARPASPAAAPESAPPTAPAEPPAPQVAALPPAPAARPLPDIRSLGRGSGGAGGSGAGRAGIEGEPIPLDSEDPRYSDYLDQVRRRIKDKWGYPCVKNGTTRECEYKTVQLIIEFGIAKNGKVPFITVVRSSGYAIYDDYAVNAVKLADFPPIPDAFSKTGVPILATFSYVVQSSLTNILR
jgi:TonB family protein